MRRTGEYRDAVQIMDDIRREQEEDARRAAEADRQTVAAFQLAEAAHVRPGGFGGQDFGGLTIGEVTALHEVARSERVNADRTPADPTAVPPYLRDGAEALCRMHLAEPIDREAGTYRLTEGGKVLYQKERERMRRR